MALLTKAAQQTTPAGRLASLGIGDVGHDGRLAPTAGADTICGMTLNQVRSFLHGSEPLIIRMVSGREYRVKHPDYAALGQDDATFLFTDDKGELEYIRLSQLESIHLERTPAA